MTAWRAAHDDEALVRQQTQAMTAIAFGAGQSAEPLLVTTRHHTAGSLLLSRQPAQDTLLELRQAHGGPH